MFLGIFYVSILTLFKICTQIWIVFILSSFVVFRFLKALKYAQFVVVEILLKTLVKTAARFSEG